MSLVRTHNETALNFGKAPDEGDERTICSYGLGALLRKIAAPLYMDSLLLVLSDWYCGIAITTVLTFARDGVWCTANS